MLDARECACSVNAWGIKPPQEKPEKQHMAVCSAKSMFTGEKNYINELFATCVHAPFTTL